MARTLQGWGKGDTGPITGPPHGLDTPFSLVSQQGQPAQQAPAPGAQSWQAPWTGLLWQGLSKARACSQPGGGTAQGRVRPAGVAPGSFLVVIGGIREGELQAVGLSQQQADVLVAPVGCGQVLEEEQQLLKVSFF